MSVETNTTDDGLDDDEDGYDYDWKVEQDGMRLGSIGYQGYIFEYGPFDIQFENLRDKKDQDGVTLRDGSRNDLDVFDPDDEDVPEKIAIAFEVLRHELC